MIRSARCSKTHLNLTIQLSKSSRPGEIARDAKCADDPAPIRSSPHPGGGGKRIRTADPLLAKQVLYQLSYTPESVKRDGVVGLGRFELPTSPLSGVRSAN